MEKILYAAMCAILFLCCSSSDESEANSQSPFTLPDKAIVLAEQASKSVVILDIVLYGVGIRRRPVYPPIVKHGFTILVRLSQCSTISIS